MKLTSTTLFAAPIFVASIMLPSALVLAQTQNNNCLYYSYSPNSSQICMGSNGTGTSAANPYNPNYNTYNYSYPNNSYNNLYGSYPYGNSALTGGFTLSSDATSYCVGQAPTYTILAPVYWNGQTIHWQSVLNGSVIGESTYTMGQDNNGHGFWQGTGGPWQTRDIGLWTKTASVGGSTQTLTVAVQDCGPYNNNTTGPYNGYNGNGVVSNYYNTSALPAGSYYDNNGYICMPRQQ